MSFLIILISILSLFNTHNYKGSKMYNYTLIRSEIEQKEYKTIYDSVINYIKSCEGYSQIPYNDNGYKAIGYGQRLSCFNGGLITDSLSVSDADSILRISFADHLRLSRLCFPKLSKYKVLAVAHMSYCIGIGRIKQLKLIENGQLNTGKLLKIRNKERRMFEIRIFKITLKI
jgi:GH24 family phage-related lysozyme (muramidase)